MRVYKKPPVYEAIQWSGSNWHEVYAAFGHDVYTADEDGQVTLRIVATPTRLEYVVMPGEYIIGTDDGNYLVPMSKEKFQASFDPIPLV